jgi:hypothetical protein
MWQEREQQFQKIIEEARAAVASERAHSMAPSEAAASDVADITSLEQVESLEEDEQWSQVGKGQRKAVLSKKADVLATKVRRSLAKVSINESPFCKKPKAAAK